MEVKMTKFFERYSELCAKAGTTPNGAAKIIGISSASITDWKKGAMPRSNAIEKISTYFGVTTDYLLGYEDIKEKPLVETGDIRKQAEEMIARMDHDQLLEFIAMATEKLRQK